ncbi:TPA: hypothetical protein QDZ66_000331 [Pluralibacter gergoviae]|uniref:hypothetical protein n=1 Tax=Pluralibacter gergoviae TaxID=61647 RepID=UPI001928E839|nr:hypothetical protein [Pluralibacter gergoviae]HDS1149622.1 hypothetical protein [Pluralibacter gergoviae]
MDRDTVQRTSFERITVVSDECPVRRDTIYQLNEVARSFLATQTDHIAAPAASLIKKARLPTGADNLARSEAFPEIQESQRVD